ncbi:S8 family peptidase [Streptomyces antarcticus]|uniref:S8 family peptidase n=1 Tax=Streptomyces antarcticus TaxID=2996458 RepID=UPI0022709C28|nr:MULTISPECIES: S8 family serine peptidase [unclassified Streptomyces]MCY0939940.1 S8 family serine peptidase [Streptomyces sp. H34-AA3]MCZ4086297.1 S8 family serine peptidase [Streptomyces sp. H34-S5]
MHATRRRLISVVAISVTLLAGTATASVAVAADFPAPAGAAAAAAAPVENLIVGYKASASEASSNTAAAADAAAKSKKAGKKAKFDRRLGTGAALVNLGQAVAPADAADVIAQFRADPDVAYVEPDSRAYALAATPDDTDYAKQWDLFEPTAGMNVPAAWDKTTGSGVTVAVIDTGSVAHSDLAANTVAGYDFITSSTAARDGNGRDNNPADQGDWSAAGECSATSKASDSSWHGTHVAGTIAAATGNSKGIAGIAYNARIQPVRVLGKCGGATSDIVDAITWASGGTVPGVPANATPAKVINMSLGGSGACGTSYQNAINAAVGRGTTVVVAAGNSNADAAGFSPASCNNVINVAASNRTGDRSFYSNYGSIIDVAAPGGETRRATDTPGTVTTPENGILSTLNAGTTTPGAENYKPYQGTSMAAPHVAGLAALLVAAKPTLTPAQIESAIKTNARPLAGTCTGGCGTGLADATATVNAVATTPTTPTFQNTTDVAIGDNTTVESPITVTGVTGNAPATLKAGVTIAHTYTGDLKVDLVAPDGSVYTLHNRTGGSADNISQTYTVNASTEAANGTWKLRVNDNANGDTGKIDAWNLTF